MDTPRHSRKHYRVAIVCGSLLMALPQALPILWGNLTVYVYSYFISHGKLTSRSPWVISVFIMLRAVGLVVQGRISDQIGHRLTVTAAIVVSSLGAFLSFLTVQLSMTWLTVTMAAVFGFGGGVLTAWLFQLVVDCADKNVAFLTSLILASMNAGGMVLNQTVTFYVNPSNRQTDLNTESGKYFTRKEMVDKVPYVFVIIGGFTLGTEVLGFCLVEFGKCIWSSSEVFEDEKKSVAADDDVDARTSYRSVEHLENGAELINRDSKKVNSTEVFNSCLPSTVNKSSTSESGNASQEKEYTPKTILRTGLFYAMWTTFLFSEMPYVLLCNYYKLFGQVRIDDDNFLTVIGTTRTFCDIWGRLLWGALMDKIGVKNTMLIITAGITLTLTWYYFTLQVDKWVFFVMTVVFSNLCSAWFTSYVSLTAALYGKKNVSTNLGLLKSSSLFLNLIAPSYFEAMLTSAGWFYTFLSTGVMAFLGFLLIRTFLPDSV